MTARAESSIFWPGMTKDIAATRDRCTASPHPNQSCPPPPRRHLYIRSNMYVETSFTTWAYLTWSWWTDIHTGPSSPHPGKEPRDSSIPYGTPSLPMGSQTRSHPTADQSSRHRSLEPSSKTGTCTTGCHQPTIPTPTAGRR